ncbi:hypothetical protein [Cellulosimicrobium sp. Marseille-Q4280]|uniref:hypothetical protein n=1 Tax=Cellulosimicrobium sp. Marseille-Q4280 TaxID=2937992 RepID=UPI00203B717D|nr:hypothetical protein [Cellulosimicrobium sp. Marseille-Q4280]
MSAPRPARHDEEPAAIGRAIDRITARRLKAAKAKASRSGKVAAKGKGAKRSK